MDLYFFKLNSLIFLKQLQNTTKATTKIKKTKI